MIILGPILPLIGWASGLSLLSDVGGILLVVGVVVLILGGVGRHLGKRRVLELAGADQLRGGASW